MAFSDPYTPFVLAAYAASALILAALIWVSAIASRRVRADLEQAEKDRAR